MKLALISFQGDVLGWFEDVDAVDEAYKALDETPEADLVAFDNGLPVPPPPRIYRISVPPGLWA